MGKYKAIKYRIYPTAEQKVLIAKTFGCSRFVYNQMLDLSKEAYSNGEHLTSRIAFNYRLTDLKKEFPWLYEVDNSALRSANDALANAFSNFFGKRAGFPKYHKKKLGGSYTSKTNGHNNIALEDKQIKIPKLGRVKAKLHRMPENNWEIKTVTISQVTDGKYYASVMFEIPQEEINYKPDLTNAIGLDYASDGLYVDDKGNVGSNHKFYRESQKKLAKAQHNLSRKIKQSNNYIKQQRKVGKIHRHIANQRLDNLHKLSTEIANQYDVVCVESLNMRSMSNKGFGNGKATMDNGYGMFLTLLEYKLADRGKLLVKVDKWFPSSQICHRCGAVHKEMKDLTIRTMRCDCGLTIGRDQNAAINIRNEGLRILKSA